MQNNDHLLVKQTLLFFFCKTDRLTINFVYQIDGYVSLITVLYCLFKSFAESEHLLLPTITPSGFNIGTNLKMNLSRSSLAGPESLVRKSKIPFIIHDAGVSPGWTRADITTARFFLEKIIETKKEKSALNSSIIVSFYYI